LQLGEGREHSVNIDSQDMTKSPDELYLEILINLYFFDNILTNFKTE
jgi:hypothetical protein